LLESGTPWRIAIVTISTYFIYQKLCSPPFISRNLIQIPPCGITGRVAQAMRDIEFWVPSPSVFEGRGFLTI
jgi:hypothetical protein